MAEKAKKTEEINSGEDKAVRLSYSAVTLGLLAVLIIVMAYNQVQISGLYTLAAQAKAASLAAVPSGSQGSATQTAQLADVRPTGTPEIYGAELGIRYDDVSAANPQLADQTIYRLAAFDQQITLEGNDLERYIRIGLSISCEYCCGAESIIFSNGEPACGCAHSYAMRGLAKYLITSHGGEFTDEQILEELGKWKVLFFPDIHAQKAAVLEGSGIELNYINLASNKYRGIEQGALSGGSMVGGC